MNINIIWNTYQNYVNMSKSHIFDMYFISCSCCFHILGPKNSAGPGTGPALGVIVGPPNLNEI